MDSSYRRFTAYLLGTGYKHDKDGQPFVEWPYFAYFTPDNPTGAFCLGEGDARNGNSRFIDASLMLEPIWYEHLGFAGVLWLVPLLEKIVGGEKVLKSEVVAAYEMVHGAKPKIEEWKTFFG